MVQLSHLARPGEPRWRSESTLLALRARTACYNKLAGSWRLEAARSIRQCPPPDGTRSAPALSGWGASRLDGTGSAPALRGFARVSLDALVVAACGYHCLLCCQLQSFRLLHVLVFWDCQSQGPRCAAIVTLWQRYDLVINSGSFGCRVLGKQRSFRAFAMMAFLFWHQILELEHLLWLDGVPTFTSHFWLLMLCAGKIFLEKLAAFCGHSNVSSKLSQILFRQFYST